MSHWDADPASAFTALHMLGWVDPPEQDGTSDEFWQNLAQEAADGAQFDRDG